MQRQVPKPYLQVGGCSILEHTLSRFLPLEGLHQVIISTSGEYLSDAGALLDAVLPEQVLGHCVTGGKNRQQSIYNALREVKGTDLVLVHDAVRPFVELSHVQECCREASEMGAAILGIPAKDTIKKVDERQFIRQTPNRERLWQTQTPQVFQKALIVEAYERAVKEQFIGTDDASLVERLGKPVKMVRGKQTNFKITFPLDLKLAKLLIGESG